MAVRDWAESDSDEDEEDDLFDVPPDPPRPLPRPGDHRRLWQPFSKGVMFKMLSRDQKGKVEACLHCARGGFNGPEAGPGPWGGPG